MIVHDSIRNSKSCAKTSLGRHGMEITVGRGNEPEITVHHINGTHRPERFLLQNPEKGLLHVRGSSPTSSRKRVPSSACLIRPVCALAASVKAPFSWPNRVVSTSFSGREAQSTTTKFPWPGGCCHEWSGQTPPCRCRFRR